MSKHDQVFKYQPSDDAESFVWVVVWIMTMVSPDSPGGYPSTNSLAKLVYYKTQVLELSQPMGSFGPIIKKMIQTLQKQVGDKLERLTMEQVCRSYQWSKD